MIVYKITNKINGKAYVGQTIGSIYDRWCAHKSDTARRKKYPLYQAFIKYGIDNFTVEPLEVLLTNATQDDLDNREKWWIATLQTVSPKGYNLDLGGQGSNRQFSEESRKKMSLAKLGKKRKPYSDKTRALLSAANKGKKISEEAKHKLSMAGKGRKAWNKGIQQTEEVKKKISITKRNQIMNKTRKEIECIARLQELTTCMDEMLAFMLSESLITKEEIVGIKRAPDPAKLLQAHLATVSATNKIQLLEYTWNYLPVERLKILIVTDRNSKEFPYNF